MWQTVFFPACITLSRNMTVAAFKQRLSRFPDDALCCGTFWLASDFLALDSSLTEDDIDAAMELAQHCHDANERVQLEPSAMGNR